ncbi:hypothetical protein IWX92DRAFT_360267 [Phyllosticta citricarpa]
MVLLLLLNLQRCIVGYLYAVVRPSSNMMGINSFPVARREWRYAAACTRTHAVSFHSGVATYPDGRPNGRHGPARTGPRCFALTSSRGMHSTAARHV